LGALIAARLPFDSAARIVALVHVTRPKRTVKRPRASATAELRRGPTETVTRSLGLKAAPGHPQRVHGHDRQRRPLGLGRRRRVARVGPENDHGDQQTD
jgi:hypothetical protein